MKNFFIFFVIIITVILQITVITKIPVFTGVFNLPYLVMLSLIFIKRKEEAIYWACVGGLLLDINSLAPFGLYTITFIFSYFLFLFVNTRLFPDPDFYIIIAIFVIASIILDIGYQIYIFDLKILLSNAIYNTVIGFTIFELLKYYYKPKEIIFVE